MEEKKLEKLNARTKKNKKKKLKLKSHRIWTSVSMFILMTLFLLALILVTLVTVVDVILVNKLEGQTGLVARMVDTYEAGISDGSGNAELLKEYGTDYFLQSRIGDLLYQNGENTCVMESGTLIEDDAQLPASGFWIYVDRNNHVLTVDKDGDLEMSYSALVREAEERLDKIDPEGSEALIFYSDDRVGREMAVVDLPMWIAKDLSTGERLFVKVDFSARVTNVALMVRLLVIFCAIFGSIFVLMLINMITDIVSSNRMKKQYFTDYVTDGRNRSYFVAKGEQTLHGIFRQKKNYAVISVELVHYLNFCLCYTLGEGERLLCRMDQEISRTMGKNALVAHMDSATFAVLTEVRNEDQLLQRCLELRQALKKVNAEHRLSFHIGGYFLNKKTEDGRPKRNRDYDLEECYNNACAARETLAGNDSSAVALFDQKLIDEQRWESIVRDNQQQALDREEFIVYYQPKYDPRTNMLRGAEALIRWQSPEYGFLTPYKFIPIFEQNGFIMKIDHYMLQHAARDQRRWLDQGLKCVPISVNVSRAHFIETDLAEQIRDTVDAEGTPRNLIEIELTESAFFDDKNQLVATINRLKEYGFAVSMDDFGSGYSSLNSLKDMPLDVLKLDAEFFRGENEGDRGRIVVAEAIRLAKSLHMRTVAEGVEAREQVKFLAEQECDMIQGYYYAKPMPGADFEERIRRGWEDPESRKEEGEGSGGLQTETAGGEAADGKMFAGEIPDEIITAGRST